MRGRTGRPPSATAPSTSASGGSFIYSHRSPPEHGQVLAHQRKVVLVGRVVAEPLDRLGHGRVDAGVAAKRLDKRGLASRLLNTVVMPSADQLLEVGQEAMVGSASRERPATGATSRPYWDRSRRHRARRRCGALAARQTGLELAVEPPEVGAGAALARSRQRGPCRGRSARRRPPRRGRPCAAGRARSAGRGRPRGRGRPSWCSDLAAVVLLRERLQPDDGSGVEGRPGGVCSTASSTGRNPDRYTTRSTFAMGAVCSMLSPRSRASPTGRVSSLTSAWSPRPVPPRREREETRRLRRTRRGAAGVDGEGVAAVVTSARQARRASRS